MTKAIKFMLVIHMDQLEASSVYEMKIEKLTLFWT